MYINLSMPKRIHRHFKLQAKTIWITSWMGLCEVEKNLNIQWGKMYRNCVMIVIASICAHREYTED